MRISKVAQAGSTEAGDILVTVKPAEEKGITIDLQSKKVILKQFGPQMESVICDTLLKCGINDVFIQAQDNGALDFTIIARVTTALGRAM